MINVNGLRSSGIKFFCFALTMIWSTASIAADLAITRQDGPAGPQVRIEVQTSFERGPRTVTVPRDLTQVDRILPGSGHEYTGNVPAQYYGLLGCNWSGLRMRLKTQLESKTRETLIFIMRNILNKPNEESLATRLSIGFGRMMPSERIFFGVGGHSGLVLNDQMRQKLRDGQQVKMPDGNFADTCMITNQAASQLMESVIKVYEVYTGVSRNQQ